MISFRADSGARVCVASFLADPALTTDAFFFLLLRRFVSRPESRLVLVSGEVFVRGFFGSWGADSASDMIRFEFMDRLLGPGVSGRVEGVGYPVVTDADGSGQGDAPMLNGSGLKLPTPRPSHSCVEGEKVQKHDREQESHMLVILYHDHDSSCRVRVRVQGLHRFDAQLSGCEFLIKVKYNILGAVFWLFNSYDLYGIEADLL